MLNRPTRHQTYLEVARAFAKRSTCQRLNVGAVIVQNRQIIAHGYNGSKTGQPHCIGNECPGRFYCQETVHAEHNALIRAPIFAPLNSTWDLYVTHSLCKDCCKLIKDWHMVKRIFFEIPYRCTDHLDKVVYPLELYQILPAGYTMNWFTRELTDVAS